MNNRIVTGIGFVLELESCLSDIKDRPRHDPFYGHLTQKAYEALKRWQEKDKVRADPYVRFWNNFVEQQK